MFFIRLFIGPLSSLNLRNLVICSMKVSSLMIHTCLPAYVCAVVAWLSGPS